MINLAILHLSPIDFRVDTANKTVKTITKAVGTPDHGQTLYRRLALKFRKTYRENNKGQNDFANHFFGKDTLQGFEN